MLSKVTALLGVTSATHRTFDRLQAPVDLIFHLAVAPGQFDGVADGEEVTVQDLRETDN